MDPQIQTSFIPKDTMKPKVSAMSGPVFSLVGILAGIIFVLAVGSWGGVYFYKQNLVKKVDELKASLRNERNKLDQKTLVEFERMDRLLRVSDKLLSQHSTIVPLFNVIEARTLRDVKFKNFQFAVGASATGPSKEIRVRMSGQADSYIAVAQQADLFGNKDGKYKEGVLSDVVFSNLNLDPAGNVVFDVTFLVDPRLLSYKLQYDPLK